jgi:hypothetical protein
MSDPYQAYKTKLNELKMTKHRRNGVRALELVLAFSPTFIKGDKGEYHLDAKERIRWWELETIGWLKKVFGERCVSAWRHADESSIHIHALIIPYEKKIRKSGKVEFALNARGITGGSEKLVKLQDSYAEAMELYLDRGLRGSKATHTTLKQYYSAIQHSRAECAALGVESPNPVPEKFNVWRATMQNVIEALKDAKQTDSKKLEAMISELVQTNEALRQKLSAYESAPSLRRY